MTKKNDRSDAINYEENYQCQKCGKKFRLKMSLNNHKSVCKFEDVCKGMWDKDK